MNKVLQIYVQFFMKKRSNVVRWMWPVMLLMLKHKLGYPVYNWHCVYNVFIEMYFFQLFYG